MSEVNFESPFGAGSVQVNSAANSPVQQLTTHPPIEQITAAVAAANPANPVTPAPISEAAVFSAPLKAEPISASGAVQVVNEQKGGALATRGSLTTDYLPELGDLIIPRINIVQNLGELGKSFPVGCLIYGQNTCVFSPPTAPVGQTPGKPASPPLEMVILGWKPVKTPEGPKAFRFVEKVAGGGRGLICNTEAEVVAAGGTLAYKEWKLKEASGMKYFVPLAEAMIALKRPAHLADDDTVFVYEINGAKYAIALWAFKATSYTEGCKKTLFPARQMGFLIGGYPSRSVFVSTRLAKYGTNTEAWVPVILPGPKSTPEVLKFAAEVIG
jgi:hypothetical protein